MAELFVLGDQLSWGPNEPGLFVLGDQLWGTKCPGTICVRDQMCHSLHIWIFFAISSFAKIEEINSHFSKIDFYWSNLFM